MENQSPRRSYRMTDRAKAQEETRARIIATTVALHDEQGIAATSFVDIAKRAGIGAATVYRHFPTVGALVAACGAHVRAEMAPPDPARADDVFAGLDRLEDRLARLVDELDRFYRRGAARLAKAHADRAQIAELDSFLSAIDTGVTALVRAALRDDTLSDVTVGTVCALADFAVWTAMQRIPCDAQTRNRRMVTLLQAALAAEGDRAP